MFSSTIQIKIQIIKILTSQLVQLPHKLLRVYIMFFVANLYQNFPQTERKKGGNKEYPLYTSSLTDKLTRTHVIGMNWRVSNYKKIYVSSNKNLLKEQICVLLNVIFL